MLKGTSSFPHTNLWNNLSEVQRILEIHEQATGKEVGFRHGYEVLNKSAIVLLVGCWEAFVEDLAQSVFEILLKKAKTHTLFPWSVLSEASKELKDADDKRKVWQLAGDGWKHVLESHKKDIFKRYLGKLNTPKPGNVDLLYKELLGIKSISANWHWPGMSATDSIAKLTGLVELRSAIAHRVRATRAVHKSDVKNYIEFVNRIAIETSNQLSNYLNEKTKMRPWMCYTYLTKKERSAPQAASAAGGDLSKGE